MKDEQKGLTNQQLIAKYGQDKTDFKKAIDKMIKKPAKASLKSDKQAKKH